MNYGNELQANTTPIPGLTVWELPVHGDNRGWFKENWQRRKMTAAGLPDFGPVQNNVSFNDAVGTTRGIHAEPWDKFVSVATGRIFGAWVDMREGPSFGAVFTAEIDPSRAVYVPRGVGNSFQTLEPNTAYSYLVNDHFSSDAEYASLNLADETVAIQWPIPLGDAELSPKDRSNPFLAEIKPISSRRILVIGAGGQLGRALKKLYRGSGNVDFPDREELDLASSTFNSDRNWREFDVIINAAAFTAVDAAETEEGRVRAWATNVSGVAALARIASENGITLVHVSSDYVFDGCAKRAYRENDPMSPLGVYGQTKAAGDEVVSTVRRHYIVRTSWVVGEGRNFVETMRSLAERGVNPSVVNDQFGRLTFASELAQTIRHLLETNSPYGTYNVTGSGPATTWAQVAQGIFSMTGHDPARVTGVSSDAYFATAVRPISPRPRNSVLDLTKIRSTGYVIDEAAVTLAEYLRADESQSDEVC